MTNVTTKEIKKENLDEFAREAVGMLRSTQREGAHVLALSGDLGAGKTTFVQALARQLGITESVTSPTFTIMKGYETTDDIFTQLIHMDAYRIDSEEELRPLRFLDLLTMPQTLICIEWAELIKEALPAGTPRLTLSVKDETTRTATLS